MPVMMTEVRAQAGTQADFTTPATPTVSLRGIEELTLSPANEAEVLMDMTTGLAGGNQGVVYGIAGAGSVSGWASYEHIAYWLDNMFGQATPSGAGPYIRSYAAPVATAPAPRFLSLVMGDAVVGAYQLVGGLLTNFTLRFEQRQSLKFSGDLIGTQLMPDTLETLTIPVVNPVMAHQLAGFKMDTWAGTMGTTAVNNCTVRFAEFVFEPDRASRPCFGVVTSDQYVERPWTGSLELGLEFLAQTKAVVDSIVGGTLTQRQIEMTATDGARILKLQFAGTVIDDINIFDDDDGVVSVNIKFERTYHTTFANWFKAVLTNAVATLT